MENPLVRVGFNQYVEGSYFGDSDVFSKTDWDSSAIAILESNLLVLGKRDLKKLIRSDLKVESEMVNVALERADYHLELQCEALVREQDHKDII